MPASVDTTTSGPDTLSLAGKVAIVTGSGRENGLGAAIAIAFGRNGASVTLTYVTQSSEKRAKGVAETIISSGGKAIVAQGDLTTPEGAENIVQETVKAFGEHIDILGTYNSYSPVRSQSI
jgi:NAD(P)-dependent dehydrogenase (short-subunit alcohol dehydrogenase family)